MDLQLESAPAAPHGIADSEGQRLKALNELDIQLAPADHCFDDLVAVAARVCDTPIALISLVDESSLRFKARLGLDVAEMAREATFCSYAIAGSELFLVPDARLDPRFADNPLVTGASQIRFYAGAPLITRQGHALGTLCVMDRRPRELSDDQRVILTTLARQVVDQFLCSRYTSVLEWALLDANKSTARLRRAFDSSFVGIANARMDGEITDANDAFLNMMGYSRAELRDGMMDPHAITPPEWLEKTSLAVARLDAAGELGVRERVYVRKDGKRVPVLVSATKPDDSDECMAFVVDLSPLREAESALRKSELRLRGMFDGAPIGAVFTALDGTFERVNPAFCRIVGYTEQELIGRTFFELIHPDDRSSDPASLRSLIDGQIETYHREKRYLHKDGHEVWVLLLASVIRDERGQALGFAAQAQEIGERKRAEQALRLSEARLTAIMDSAYDAILVTDAHAIIRYVNPACEELFGFASGEMIGVDSNVLLPEEYREHNRRELARFRATGQPLSLIGARVEVTSLRKDGTQIPVEMSLTTWTAQGETFFAGIARGISERKRIQAELVAAKLAAEEAAHAKSAFLARMSHEIRTPMNGVSGMIELALRTPLTPVQRDYLETARSSSESLLCVINDVLDFSKIEAGKLSLAHQPFSLQQCLEEAVRALAPLSSAKGLELMLSLPQDVPDGLVGDRWRLRQVVTNLLSNAIKFTDEGEIVVAVRSLATGDGAVTIEVRVSDTGIGIPASEHEAVFETFRQAEETATRRFGGTGLGLAICKQLVALMDGTIGLESLPAGGSSFHFSARFELDPAPARQVAPEALRGVTALLVVSNPRLRALVAELLSRWQIRAVAVESREQAVAAAREASDTVRLHLIDDDMAGADQLEADLGLASGAEVRVVRFSKGPIPSRPDGEDWRRAWLSKPITATVLLETIQGLLASGDTLRSGMHPVARTPSGLPALRVLLAEDNPINQRVATILLQSDGHSVIPVANGRLALEAYAIHPFDVVLMDVQMPEMDGLQAMRAIRAQENSAGHVPIVALTAQALRGDREVCLEAGADAYLSKPFNADELFRAIELAVRLRPREAAAGGAGSHPIVPHVGHAPFDQGAIPVFDAETLLGALGGDEAAARAVMSEFFIKTPSMQLELAAGLAADESPAIRAAAHKLKGMLLTLGARRAAEAANRLEAAIRLGLLDTARQEGQTLTIERERFAAEAADWAGDPSAARRLNPAP